MYIRHLGDHLRDCALPQTRAQLRSWPSAGGASPAAKTTGTAEEPALCRQRLPCSQDHGHS